jgi:hypothetical protein
VAGYPGQQGLFDDRLDSNPVAEQAGGVPDSHSVPQPARGAADADGQLFDLFWRHYPKRVSKKDARTAFDRALRDTLPEVILAGIKRYAAYWQAEKTEERFIPHAATWINRRQWEDELTMPKPAGWQGRGHPSIV